MYKHLKQTNDILTLSDIMEGYLESKNSSFLFFKIIFGLLVRVKHNQYRWSEIAIPLWNMDLWVLNHFDYRISKTRWDFNSWGVLTPTPQSINPMVPIGGGQYHSFTRLKATMTNLFWLGSRYCRWNHRTF